MVGCTVLFSETKSANKIWTSNWFLLVHTQVYSRSQWFAEQKKYVADTIHKRNVQVQQISLDAKQQTFQ